jgi:acyl carrier protein
MTTEEKIISLIATDLCLSEDLINPSFYLIEDLGADSLDLLQIMVTLEEQFDIDISDSEAEKVETIQDAIDLVERLS